MVGWSCLAAECPPSCFLVPPAHQVRGRKKDEKTHGSRKGQGDCPPIKQNRLNFGKINLQKIENIIGWWKTKIKTFSQVKIFCINPERVVKGCGEYGLSQFLNNSSLLLPFSHLYLGLLQCPSFGIAVIHILLECEFFPQAALYGSFRFYFFHVKL